MRGRVQMGTYLGALLLLATGAVYDGIGQPVLVENFSYQGDVPTRWRELQRRAERAQPLPGTLERDDDYVEVVTLDGEKVLRVFTHDEAVHAARINGQEGFDWDTRTYPFLAWRWRADQLPVRGREDVNKTNDTGAAFYVAFDCNDWLRRPCVIKYTYSSSLPVGATARYAKLRVLVVSSAQDGMGQWIDIKRNVREDFRMLFQKEAPPRPIFIMVWGDSDTTDGVSEAYFDTIMISADA